MLKKKKSNSSSFSGQRALFLSYRVYVDLLCSPTDAWCDVWQISPSPARLTVNVHLAASHGYLLFSASQGFSDSEQSASDCLKELRAGPEVLADALPRRRTALVWRRATGFSITQWGGALPQTVSSMKSQVRREQISVGDKSPAAEAAATYATFSDSAMGWLISSREQMFKAVGSAERSCRLRPRPCSGGLSHVVDLCTRPQETQHRMLCSSLNSMAWVVFTFCVFVSTSSLVFLFFISPGLLVCRQLYLLLMKSTICMRSSCIF